MQIQVKTWGNSQGTRISKEILQEANIAVDDVLDVKVVNEIIMSFSPLSPVGSGKASFRQWRKTIAGGTFFTGALLQQTLRPFST